MASQPRAKQSVIAMDEISMAAAAARLNAETRAFGNAVEKLNLQHATAAFERAKQALQAETLQTKGVRQPSK